MALSLQQRIEEVGRKIERLERERRELLQQNVRLKAENADLTDENRRLRAELTSAQRDAEFLSMSHRLASDADSIVKARRRISGMIREIDRCISQLKE